MRSELAALVIAGAICAGCGPSVTVKPPPASQAAFAQRGATVKFPHQGFDVEGELLAVEPDTAYIQILGSDEIMAVPLHVVSQGVVWNYRPSPAVVLIWGLIGTASTISHGFVLILSAPAWIASTALVAGAVSWSGQSRHAEAKWARYPQGLPKALRDRVVDTPSWFPTTGVTPTPTPGRTPRKKPTTPTTPVL